MEENINTKVVVDKITYDILMQHFAPNNPNRFKPLTDGTYTATYSGGNQNFIELNRVNNDPPQQLSHEELIARRYAKKNSGGDCGWKFHVSVNQQAFGLSCDLIYNVLDDNQVKGFKIANPHSKEFEGLLHSGRGITIYAFKEPQRSFVQNDQVNNNNNVQPWDTVLNQISSTLDNYTILPGPIAEGNSGGGTNERTLSNNPFITFRYDDRPQNVGGVGKVGSSMDPNADLEENFIGGRGPHLINENFSLNNSQQNNLSQEITITNNKPSEETHSYFNYQTINFHNFDSRKKRKEMLKNKNITNSNNEENQTVSNSDEHTWQRSKSPEKNDEKETKSSQQNNQNSESCQPETKYEKDPRNPDQDKDKGNDNNFSQGFTIGIGGYRGRS